MIPGSTGTQQQALHEQYHFSHARMGGVQWLGMLIHEKPHYQILVGQFLDSFETHRAS